jgi:prephenate dehydrogenase
MKKRLAIIGLGLMGGSLGLAVRRKRLPYSVVGYARREETRRIAMKRRAVEFAFDNPRDAVAGADIVVFCLPVLTIPKLVRDCMPCFAPGCIVTDVGSTKSTLISGMKRLFKGNPAAFVGSHPIAGSDETGIESARHDLYEGAVCVVTDEVCGGKKTRASGDIAKVVRFWKGIGMDVVVMSAGEHDRTIARTSHLPHLIASVLVSTVCKANAGKIERFCGTGFRDTTRIAGGSESIWHDIVKTNSKMVGKQLGEFQKELAKVKNMIDSGDFNGVRRFLAQTREKRRSFDA